MIETIALAVGFIGLLVFLLHHEREEREYIKKIQTDLTNLPIELQKFYSELSEKDTARSQKIIGDSFKEYLKHIERLERMVLPKPVTVGGVKSVMTRIGEMADESLEIANDIEKEKDKGVELPNDEWTGFINADTKIAFENEEAPTVVES